MKTALLFLSILVSTSYASHTASSKNTRADLVYICDSKNAKVYHSYECRGLNSCTHQTVKVSKDEAVKMGRRACKVCY